MKLYNYWRSSSSYRVRIALHFKGLPFEYVAVNLLKGEHKEEAHRGRNPITSVPVLEVTEGGKTVEIAQSVAIVEYLEEKYPERKLFPADAMARAQVRMMVETINSGVQPFHNLATLNYVRDRLHGDEKAWAGHWVELGLASLEVMAQRSAGTFLLGDTFTWADACLVPQLMGARRFVGDLAKYPTLLRVEQACLATDWVKKSKPEVQPDAQPT